MNGSNVADFIPLRQPSTDERNANQCNFNLTKELDSDKIRHKYGIEVEGNNIPPPFTAFEDMNLPYSYLSHLKNISVVKPTPIQMQALSCLTNHRDIIGISSTGSGKTYAYVLPLLMILNEHVVSNDVSPISLILVPSRELMSQVLKIISECLDAAGNEYAQGSMKYLNDYKSSDNGTPQYHTSLHEMHKSFNKTSKTVVGICGGYPIANDFMNLSPTTKVIVATPGRLMDLCDRNKLCLSRVKYFVIDECDKLLEMGLEEQLRRVVAMVTVHKRSLQTSLWSATLPESLERIARSAVVDPIYICTGIKYTVSSNIKQNVIFMHNYMKPKELLNVLRQIPYPPVIIFVRSRQKADEVCKLLLDEQFHVAAIHSDKQQTFRNEVMDSYRGSDIDILVATDLISRGLDIPAVTHVINYDMPDTIEDYLHRCGRTGRLGREGAATTFLTLDCKIANELKEMLESTNNDIPTELLDTSMFGKKVISTEMGDRVIS